MSVSWPAGPSQRGGSCRLQRRDKAWSGPSLKHGQPSLRARKQRQLELTAGARKGRGGAGIWKANAAVRDAERKMAEQAEAAYRRNVAEFKRVEALRAKQRKQAQTAQAERDEEGAGATSGRAS